VEQLSGLDTFFISAEMHGMPMHISSLSIYDPSTSENGVVEFTDILQLFEEKIQNNVPALRKKLVQVPYNLDQPYWEEDPHFDLVYNIRHIALPKPGTWQKLCSMVANLHAQPLNRNRPLWEMYVIDGLDSIEGIPTNAFAIMLKVHHAIMDGRTGMAIYSNLHTLSPKKELRDKAANVKIQKIEKAAKPEADKLPAVKNEGHLSSAGMFRKAYTNNLRKTGSLFKMAGKTISLYTKVQLGLKTKELKSLEKPKTRFNGAISPRRVVDRVRFSMEGINTIKSVFPTETLNDVALTIIGGALRTYLLSKGELPEEDSLVAGVPIDVRTPDDEHKNGNMINFMNVSLRTDISEPLERLHVVHKEAEAGKAYAKTLGDDIVTDVLDNLYSGLVSWGVRTAVDSGIMGKFPPVNNTIVTNVPGYPCPVYMCGAQLIESFGMGPLIPNTGLFHTVATTYDFLTIGVTACRQMMEDPSFYIQCLQESYDELYEASIAYREEQASEQKENMKRAKPHLVKSSSSAKKSPKRKVEASKIQIDDESIETVEDIKNQAN